MPRFYNKANFKVLTTFPEGTKFKTGKPGKHNKNRPKQKKRGFRNRGAKKW